jgi:hypothetical protein
MQRGESKRRVQRCGLSKLSPWPPEPNPRPASPISAPAAVPLRTLANPYLQKPQTVKKIWAYVKERDLQDPSDKRQIRCDDKMHAVFKQDKVHMFTMNKLLAAHYYPMEEVEGVVEAKEEMEG